MDDEEQKTCTASCMWSLVLKRSRLLSALYKTKRTICGQEKHVEKKMHILLPNDHNPDKVISIMKPIIIQTETLWSVCFVCVSPFIAQVIFSVKGTSWRTNVSAQLFTLCSRYLVTNEWFEEIILAEERLRRCKTPRSDQRPLCCYF